MRYQGQYLDRETDLHYNTFRYYDPDIGRFTQPDPIGLLGSDYFYKYTSNPIHWVDPLGLESFLFPTENVFYSQDNVDSTFKDGRTLQSTVDAYKAPGFNPRFIGLLDLYV